MAEQSNPEERTELPTQRRINELRKDGSVHHSQEVVKVVSILAGFLMLKMVWQQLVSGMEMVMRRSFTAIAAPQPFSSSTLINGFTSIVQELLLPVALIVLVIAVFASLAVMLQTEWCVKDKLVKFQWNMLHPLDGLKRILSPVNMMQTLTAIIKLAIILPIGFFALKAYAPEMIMLIHLTVPDVLHYTGSVMFGIFWKIMYVLIALAALDYFYTRFQWFKRNKMTKDEIKDERKAIEGDERTKRRIQQKGMQRIMQRIRSSVPQADVVVTNPTHYAIALKYDRGKMNAPIVVAKGRGFLALRIREMAREAGVPVLERKALARALYASVEVGGEIPHELFRAVAEVLAYVYRLKNPYRYAQSRT